MTAGDIYKPGSLYDLLEVSPSATLEDIERAYQRIVSYLDSNSLALYSMIEDDEATLNRASVDRAFQTLADPDRRALYDQSLAEGHSDYPALLVPNEPSDSNVTLGKIASSDFFPRKEIAPVVLPDPAPRPNTNLKPNNQLNSATGISNLAQTKKPLRRLITVPDVDLSDDIEFSGALLKRLRESAKAELDEVAEITKISKRYLRAIEDNDFTALPAAVYVRGFVCEYARALGLDPHRVAKSYMGLYQRYRGGAS